MVEVGRKDSASLEHHVIAFPVVWVLPCLQSPVSSGPRLTRVMEAAGTKHTYDRSAPVAELARKIGGGIGVVGLGG